MGEVVNLRRARKQKQRDDKETLASQNRIEFGRSTSEKVLQTALNTKATKALDGHLLSPKLPPLK